MKQYYLTEDLDFADKVAKWLLQSRYNWSLKVSIQYCKKDAINNLFFGEKNLMSILVTVSFSYMLECKEVQEMGSFAYFGPDMEVKWIYPQVIIMQKPATVYLLIKQGLIIEKFCFKD